jgi:hypothetical protein
MPIAVAWGDVSKTIIVSTFKGEWTLEDSHNMIDEMYQLTSSVNHIVHVVLDFTDSLSSPAKMLSSGSHIEKRSSPNSGLSVIVKANGFIKAISQLIMKLFVRNGKLYFVDTVDEAYQIIAQYGQTQIKG